MTVNELIASPDIRGEEFEIKAIENGFIVKFEYRQKPDAEKEAKEYWNWSYKSKSYVFTTWAETAKFIGENALPLPPK